MKERPLWSLEDVVHFNNISDITAALDAQWKHHPHILFTKKSFLENLPLKIFLNKKITMGFYTISLKDGTECGVHYGRTDYDFQAGTLMFTAPGQVLEFKDSELKGDHSLQSWNLIIHPDLLKGTPLGDHMEQYRFFHYYSHEALHVSEEEQKKVTQLAELIHEESLQDQDRHSGTILTSHLELLLNYCLRYYDKQFTNRHKSNKEVITRKEKLLSDFWKGENSELTGIPTVKYCADELGYSPNYLSELLKKETGCNTQEIIHESLLLKAKDLLAGSHKTISEIAFSLGFEYPQHFSQFFKKKTGKSPSEFRL